MTIPRIAAKARLQWDEVRERNVLLYPEGLVTLNPTGAEILRLCDGVRPVTQIVSLLEERFHTQGIAGDVTAFLEGLTAKGLVTWY